MSPFLQTLVITIVVVLVVVAMVFAAYWLFFRQTNENGMGFMDYVKDPSAPERLDVFAERDAIVEELAKEPPTVLVDLLLEEADQFEIPSRAIRAAGPKVVSALLAAVTDPRFRGGNQKRYGEPLEPLQGVLSCLTEYAPGEAVPVVVPLIKDENAEVRKEVALLLGAIANDEAVTPIKQLLQDENTCSYAIMGICEAIGANRVSDGFRREVFDDVLPLAFRDTMSGSNDAPRCLLGLDREKAIAALTDPNHLKADQEELNHVLAALREAKVVVDEASLFKILSELDAKEIDYSETRIMGETLMMLAMTNSDRARAAIKKRLEHPSKDVQEYAAKALALDAGIDPTFENLWKNLDEKGWEGVSAPQRHVLTVRMLIDEVNNGGFFQYFVNSSGNYWQDAREGLGAIGANSDKQLFEQALKLFGSELPSEDRSKRHEQTAKIADKDEKAFSTIESAFFEDKDNREVLLLQYMLKNADEFK